MPMVKVPYPKHLISFADQISLLKQRGLSFKDETKALHLLQNISYYRLSGYWFTDTSLFSNSMRHAKILAKIDEEYQRSDEEFVTAFKSKYSDRFPPSLDDNGDYIVRNIVYFLNTINPNHSFVTRFKDLLERYHLIDVRAMGFPENWENEGIWDERKQGERKFIKGLPEQTIIVRKMR